VGGQGLGGPSSSAAFLRGRLARKGLAKTILVSTDLQWLARAGPVHTHTQTHAQRHRFALVSIRMHSASDNELFSGDELPDTQCLKGDDRMKWAGVECVGGWGEGSLPVVAQAEGGRLVAARDADNRDPGERKREGEGGGEGEGEGEGERRRG
jgi:hypothetical protein